MWHASQAQARLDPGHGPHIAGIITERRQLFVHLERQRIALGRAVERDMADGTARFYVQIVDRSAS